MSSELCPFCGKSFKRLKSHLPHCKAATAAKSEARDEKSAPELPLETKGGKQEAKRAPRLKTSKKTPKVSEKSQIAAKISPPASAESPLTSKSKTKSHKSSQNDKQSLLESVKEMTNSVTKQHDTGSKTEEPDSERQILIPATKNGKKSPDNSRNAKRTIVSKKKDEKGISTNKTGSTKATFTVNNETDYLKWNSWLEDKNYAKSLSGIEGRNKRETRITLEDVRTTLKRTKQSGSSKKDSLVDKIASEGIKCEILEQNKVENALAKVQKERPTQLTTPGSRQNEITPRESGDFLSRLSKIENKDCSFTLRSETLGAGLRMDRHSGGRAAGLSPAQTFLEAEVSAEAFGKDLAPLLKPNLEKNLNVTEETTSDVKKRDGGRCAREALAQRSLGQVTLKELPDWLVLKSPQRPRDVIVAAQRGWQWYYRRYIDVKRGGVGGVAMLLAGYCVLSYVWTFPHLKRDRWRKYH